MYQEGTGRKESEGLVIRIRVEVLDGGTSIGIMVQAESIEQALMVTGSVFPSSELRIPFPLDPDSFFVQDGSAVGLVEPDVLRQEAG